MDVSVRDYLAGQALQGFLVWALNNKIDDGYDTAEKCAKRYAKSAYAIADAMLEARWVKEMGK